MYCALKKPRQRPVNPKFSAGPARKRPGWTIHALNNALTGRSHRSVDGIERLNEVVGRSRDILGIPDDWYVGIVPASDTGAVEMALWSLLGVRGVDVLAWENFGFDWMIDITDQLPLDDVRCLTAPYGHLPPLDTVDFSRDVVFTWNGTTSGTMIPNGDWIPQTRTGLTICDGTSAVFAVDIPWNKLDVMTWSWQKVMGGEAGHGMLALSPRAGQRIREYTPPWPIPKIFRLNNNGAFMEGVFAGKTINTPSMLAVEDALDGLCWAERLGGLSALIARVNANAAAVARWVDATSWVEWMTPTSEHRSPTSLCFYLRDPRLDALDEPAQRAFYGQYVAHLHQEGVALDINGHALAPPSLRLWGGATVDAEDLHALFPWLEWAWAKQCHATFGKVS